MLKLLPHSHNPVEDIMDYLKGEFPHQVLAIQWKGKTPTFIVHHNSHRVRHDVIVTPEFLRHDGQCVAELDRLCLSKVMRENRSRSIQLVLGCEGIRIKPWATMRVAERDGWSIEPGY